MNKLRDHTNTRFNVILPNRVLKILKAIGEGEGRSVSDLIRDAISRMIRERLSTTSVIPDPNLRLEIDSSLRNAKLVPMYQQSRKSKKTKKK